MNSETGKQYQNKTLSAYLKNVQKYYFFIVIPIFPQWCHIIDLQISDSQEAPSFFTAMRGKKSYQVPDYVSENTDYQFMDKLLPEKWTEDDLITNNNRNAVQYALEEHKGKNSVLKSKRHSKNKIIISYFRLL